jgi:hypothetical protein
MHLPLASHPPRIVAIDDSRVNLMLWQTLLSDENGILECYEYENPEEAFAAIALVYLIFTLSWFECAQFAHLAWWGLSLWGVDRVSPRDRAAIPLTNAIGNPKALVANIVSILLLASGIYLLVSGGSLSFFLKATATCGSLSSGPKDNPIASVYGENNYAWTNNIKWNCVYSTTHKRYDIA